MKMLFDMASVIQTGLRKGECLEFTEVEHNGRMVKINPASHGYENAVGYMCSMLDSFKLHPSDAVMVFEGKDSKKRRMQIMPTYKGNREKSHPLYYEEYNKCKDMVKQAFRAVGSIAVVQDYAEGDDTLKYLAMGAEEDIVIVTNDGDLTVLAGKNPQGFSVTVVSGNDANKLPEGVFEASHLTLYKSLVGDTSDSIPGIKGFGKAKWEGLLSIYGGDGIKEILECVRDNTPDKIVQYANANGCKLLRMIAENWNTVRLCWKVADIYAEWVDTRYNPLLWEPGVVLEAGADERLKKYSQVKILVTADNYNEAFARLKRCIELYPNEVVALDVETSTPDETDEWMESKGKPDGVDPLTSFLAGFSLTFGPGGRFTYYASVKHFETNNITMKQAREMIELTFPVLKPIHNTNFELVVFYNDFAKDEDGTYWRDHWRNAGEYGMLPNIEDTLLMSSYVNENAMQRNLKALSRNVLGYEQVDFNTMRTFKVTSEPKIVWENDGEKAWPVYVHENVKKPYPGGKLQTKVCKVPAVDENGKSEYNSKGVQKEATVYVEVQAQNADGSLVTVRKRNPETGVMENLPKMVKVATTYMQVQYKMHELPATAVFDYGADDTICTRAYWNFARLHMIFDKHYHVYRDVEIDAAYLHAKNFYDGFPIAIHELIAQKNEDAKVLAESEAVLHSYLVSKGWAGTVQSRYTKDIDSAGIKEAYATVFGLQETDEDEDDAAPKDPVMSSRTKLAAKYVQLIEAQEREGADLFAWHLSQLLEGDEDLFNNYVSQHFTGKPRFAYGNKDMSRLLYEVMGMSIKVRNKPTAIMKAKGIREGNPKADSLAIDYAIMEAKEKGLEAEEKVLMSLKLINMVNTRLGLFYKPYPDFVHWKSGKVHSSHRQCHANTRRASSAEPNMQQMSAHEKIEGYEPRIRAVVQPHTPDAVIVAMDFNAQELRLMADDSQDPNMLACYVGDKLKDMHSITGSMIALRQSDLFKKKVEEVANSYENYDDAVYYTFVGMAKSDDPAEVKAYKEFRSLGKKVNFTALYGAQAEKLAATLMVSEEDAQVFLDARAEAFRVSEKWKTQYLVAKAKEDGFVRSKLGAKRHLAEMFDSFDRSISSKAERQAANFRIQGSAAEMTKLAEGRIWREGLTERFDAKIVGPIHDEVVASVAVKDLPQFIKEMHACMVKPYADMKIEIKSSIEFGPNMQDLIEIGMEPTDEAIAEGIAELKETYPQYA